ncbi:uncharacterized protein LOC100571294 [Acyrthosiphon pisum]|uniref:C2H2-type domain-containing protein n=1 Tax=Acyrthosiphon pisum TaxID=7029 RepID=A0A8R1W5Y7_ACYPI|nr:uncharacterized protein LOC100571294 [Acyrthosiphon pisum]|eukprot:XP_003245237.1 PREDICTED: uncharacterized protein LOC100571294 [Acyrthosiphon pisum]
MAKNPFMNCKSRKRRKARNPPPAPKEKLYCPRTMVRYDKSFKDYPTKWVCKMCLKILLSENAVKNHLTNCNAHSRQPEPAPPIVEDTPYICKYCDKVFSRGVTLKRHLEYHERSCVDSELSDNEVEHKLRNMKTERN